MKDQATGPSQTRRHFLTVGAGVLAATGVGLAAWPFISSLQPSKRARAQGGPTVIDPRKIEPGQLVTASWRGKPIFVLRRTKQMIATLSDKTLFRYLRDPLSEEPQQPEYADGPLRSRREDIFVAVGLCTHLGCVPGFRPEPGQTEFADFWPGGYFCPCHGSKFDLAGRVFKGVPAPLNLAVPPYRYDENGFLEIGIDT